MNACVRRTSKTKRVLRIHLQPHFHTHLYTICCTCAKIGKHTNFALIYATTFLQVFHYQSLDLLYNKSFLKKYRENSSVWK